MVDAEGGGFLPTRLQIDGTAFVAPNAVVVGEVTLGPRTSVWYGCVLRGDIEPIRVGADTNIQDLTVVHVDAGYPAVVGDGVTIGHRAVIHGAVLADRCLVGMGAVVLSGARVGEGALVAAGAVVREGFVVPPGALCAGVPARIVREALDAATIERIRRNAASYVAYGAAYAAGRLGGGRHAGTRP